MKINYPKNRKPRSKEAIARAIATRKETMEARRPVVICCHCKKQFKVKPSHVSNRKYCSSECRKSDSNLKERECSGCGLMQLKRPSDSKLCVSCGRKKQGLTMRERGHSPYRYETESSRNIRLEKMSSSENRERVSRLHKGKNKHTEKTKRFSENHSLAVSGVFLSPWNKKYQFKNIARFVYENSDLFLPEDVIQKIHADKPSKSYICNATQGLYHIRSGHRTTWKGWRLFSDFEITENKGRDMLGATGLRPHRN